MFQKYDWQDFYRDATDAIPGDIPEPRGNSMSTHCFVDSDLAGNTVTIRLQTDILRLCNRAPIIWQSKRQNTVKTNTFGSEFTTMKNDVKLSKALRYNFKCLGFRAKYQQTYSVTMKRCKRTHRFKNRCLERSTTAYPITGAAKQSLQGMWGLPKKARRWTSVICSQRFCLSSEEKKYWKSSHIEERRWFIP